MLGAYLFLCFVFSEAAMNMNASGTTPIALLILAFCFESTSRNAHIAMAIPTKGYILVWVFPIYATFFNKESMDLRRETDINVGVVMEEKV
ncbi:hypothetical protein VTN02DRAFT_5007 [Thermoascus thermophilus]